MRLQQAMAIPREEPFSFGLFLIGALWLILLFDVHWYVAGLSTRTVLKLPVPFFGALLLVLAAGVPSNEKWQRRWQWWTPFLLTIGVGMVTIFYALNNGYVREAVQGQLLWWTFVVGTVAIVDSPRRVEKIVFLYGIQFLWWAIWGVRTGTVNWHHAFYNYDGFGAFNVGGAGICYFLATATTNKTYKWVMYGTAALCVFGVVASFARGAFLALILLYFIIWLRSPHKGKTLAAGVGGVVLVNIAATILFHENFFWNEIMSAFHEGTESGTGEDRWILWGAAWRVFTEVPLFGAGPRNFGVLASTLYQEGELGGMYYTPGTLYNRGLHNLYLTTLSELGVVGTIALVWIFVDYFKRNAALRTEAAERRWHELGGTLKLRPLALALEAAMAAFMVNALVYSMMGIHWFYTMVALNMLLHSVAVRGAPPAQASAANRGGRAPPLRR